MKLPLLQVQGLAWGAGDRLLGSSLDLALAAGEVVAVMGRNGAGKTTLLRCLLGLLPPRSGRIELDGRLLGDWPRRELAAHVGYVAQQAAAPPAYATLDWVLLARTARLPLGRGPSPDDYRAALAALDSVGLASRAGVALEALSGGERQLAAVARALVQGSRLLLLDEPSASLDFGNRARVDEVLRSLAAAGHGILFTTHDPAQAESLARRVLLIAPGEAARIGPVAAMLEPARLAQVFGVPAELIRPYSTIR
ncbi:MAG: ABC transporter ATP-binding protein [Burkholderiaceae bacterium]